MLVSGIPILIADPAGGNDGACLLLCHLNGVNAGTTFTDYSIAGQTLTATNATTSTTRSKFFDSSGSFNGSSARVETSSTNWSALLPGDYTLEAWIFLTTASVTNPIISTCTNAVNSLNFQVTTSNKLQLSGNAGSIASSGSISASTWTHVAAVNSGGTFSLYINGVNDGSGSGITQNANGSALAIGCNGTDTPVQFFHGNIQEVRVSKIARWTANFTPPSAPYS
jgi:hypothetical protein